MFNPIMFRYLITCQNRKLPWEIPIFKIYFPPNSEEATILGYDRMLSFSSSPVLVVQFEVFPA